MSQKRMTKRQQRSLRQQGVLDEDNNVNTGKFNLKTVKPLTTNQQKVFNDWDGGSHLLLHGCAGTGKTFIGMYLGLQEVLADNFKKLVIVRSAVPTRDIGFLPGTVEEKLKVYEQPYSSITKTLFNRGDAYDILKNKFMVEFIPTSFIRGTTLDDCIVLVDEINNLTFHELDTVITRLGNNTRMILCGDINQSDLKWADDQRGLQDFMQIIDKIKSFQSTDFAVEDIVRSGLVKEYIIAKET